MVLAKYKESVLFLIAGILGFIADVSVLYISQNNLGLVYGRALSFSCSIILTWLINRNITFKNSPAKDGILIEFIKYLFTMLFGGLINYSTYYLIIKTWSGSYVPFIAVSAGCILGLFLNLLISKKFIFISNR
jgi:putative flippase GtrA